MNFQKIPPVELSKTLLDIAFRKARSKGMQKNLKGNWLEIIRKKEGLKLDIIKDNIVVRLQKTVAEFPNPNELSDFYVKLMNLTLDVGQYKKSLGAVNWGIDRVRFFHRQYVSGIFKNTDRGKIKDLSLQFYGRVSSVLKQIDVNLKYLDSCRKIMLTYPDIKEMFTVCLYGFPNVGKTTLLNKLTGTKAEVAAYSFTTKSINSGYFMINDVKVQVLDVPGTLAREEKMNNIELQAELVRKELANVIVYVFDISEQSSYSLRNQEQLFRKLGKEKKIFVYFSKMDLVSSDEERADAVSVADYIKKYRPLDLEGLKKKIGELVAEYNLVLEEDKV